MCVSCYVWTFDDEWTPSWILWVTLALPLSDNHTISACITIDFSSLQACRKWHSGTVTSNAIHWDALNFACSLNRNQPMLPQKFILLNFTLRKYNYTYTNKWLKLSVTVTICWGSYGNYLIGFYLLESLVVNSGISDMYFKNCCYATTRIICILEYLSWNSSLHSGMVFNWPKLTYSKYYMFFFHQSGLFSLKVIFGPQHHSLRHPPVSGMLFFNLAQVFHHTVHCRL